MRKWFKGLDATQRKRFWAAVKKRWYIPTFSFTGVIGYGVYYYQSHIEETPITGRRRFIAFTHEQIRKIANEEAAGVCLHFVIVVMKISRY